MNTMSRRSLTHGAAWAVPVITLAAAAPASAASSTSNAPVMAYYESADTQDTSSISNVPMSPEHPELALMSIIYAEPNGASDQVTSMRATMYLAAPDLSFTMTNGASDGLEAGQSDWKLPSGPSGTSTLNGTTVYAYDFTWSGHVAPSDSFDYQDDTYSLFDYPDLPNLRVQVTGGSVSTDTVMQSSLTVTTASGQTATRTGQVETVGSFSSPVGDPL